MLVNITLADIKVEDEEPEPRLKSEFKGFLRVKMDRYGRICIPKKVREQLGLSTSAQFTLKVVEDILVLSPLSKTPKKERKSLGENQQAVAVQNPSTDLEPIEENLENLGLARLMEETGDDDNERLSKDEALKYYQALKGNNVDS
jgi:AbrB family looped-hinge helix DNA binding protein